MELCARVLTDDSAPPLRVCGCVGSAGKYNATGLGDIDHQQVSIPRKQKKRCCKNDKSFWGWANSNTSEELLRV